MIGSYQKRKFEADVLETFEKRLLEIHGLEFGGECAGCCATVILNAREYGQIPEDLIDEYRKSGLSVDEAALAFVDLSISLMKRFAPNALEEPEVIRVLEGLEKAVDKMFLDKPGMIVPENGTAGPLMHPFTKGWNPGDSVR
jgi:hypothetical protein